MARQPIEILFIEDSELDVELSLRAIEKEGFAPAWRRVDAEPDMRSALAERLPQAILSDFSMPRFDGITALRIARELAPAVPFIFISGTIGEERAIEAIRLGATDYVLKDNLRRLGTAVRRALSEAEERIRERKAYEARIQHLANYDAVTGLPNRTLLGDRAAQGIAHARRFGRAVALISLNLDRFKLVVDSAGHGAGDELLRAVGERLRKVVRDGDTAARLSADIFAVLAADLARPDDVIAVVRKIQEALRPPFRSGDAEFRLTASIGASVAPRDGGEFELLLRNADAAMHRVKEQGRDGFQFYAEEMTREAAERVGLESELRRALERGELEMHFQPQIAFGDGGVVGVEALMRWHHAERGWISPALFMPIAEDSDLIRAIGAFAVGEGVRRLAAWDRRGLAPLRMAVNVSAR